MNKLVTYISALALCCSFAQCSDYLNTSSPENTGDEFVTSSTSETFKILSWCYANYRQNCIMGAYRWNDPIGSCLLYTSPSPRDRSVSRMPSSA